MFASMLVTVLAANMLARVWGRRAFQPASMLGSALGSSEQASRAPSPTCSAVCGDDQHVREHARRSPSAGSLGVMCDNKPFWTEFIELYREQRCLWDVKSPNYCNKHLRKESFDVLIDKCKEVFVKADEKFVKAKIDSLRASFRRELKKLNASKSTGKGLDEVYEPSLWYFELLMFTTDVETARKGLSSLQKIVAPPEDSEDNTEMTDENEAENSPSILASPDGGSSTPATPTSSLSQTPAQNIRSQTSDSASNVQRRQRKRKNVSEYDRKKESFLDVATNALNQHVNENQAFGNSIAFQLEDMDRRQKIFAQKLISDALFHGKLGHLNENSVIHLNNIQNPDNYGPNCSRGFANVQPTTYQFQEYNYGQQNYPFPQRYLPPQPQQQQAANNAMFVNESTAAKGSTTTEVDEENLGQFLKFN
ncbi:hypothetical protein J6590_074020 [Homalodisca vitripennis]|nr:hypothetical protein J6590_030380 [Homalodisca vitripennis]KAG8315285.1 hypothetical protein J6590_074020 [Homalodisca vitripennis]